MATTSAAILCSVLALLMWAPAGFLIARRLPLTRDLRLAAAPVLGWAVQHVVALNVAMLGGFTRVNVIAATALVGLAAIVIPSPGPRVSAGPSLPLWILAAAALLAAGPAIGVLPKISPAGVALAAPIYDHAKIALVDEIVRSGVPPANPFLGAADGGPGHIAYYYYWLFGAAELALIAGASGWEADVAATWYTGFASLALMCGLAFRLAGGVVKPREPNPHAGEEIGGHGVCTPSPPSSGGEGRGEGGTRQGQSFRAGREPGVRETVENPCDVWTRGAPPSSRPSPPEEGGEGARLRKRRDSRSIASAISPQVLSPQVLRAAAALFVLAAACGGSLRPLIAALAGQNGIDAALERGSGLAGWLFQTSWSPHHVASATAAVLSFVLMERLARAPSVTTTLVLGLLAAAAFGSSLWVGGVTFALCAGAAGTVLLVSAKPGRRLAFVAALTAAAGVALALVFPLLAAQLHAAAERGNGPPVLISPFPVLGPAVPLNLRGWLETPAYWLILLPIEFPAVWILGAWAVIALRSLKPALMPALAAAVASLCGGALLVSTAGENNDLGWRAVLPALLILTAYAGAWFAQCLAQRRAIGMAAGAVLVGLALPDGIRLLHENIVGRLSADAVRFAGAPALWAAVRRHTAPDERIASNPRLTNDLAPWPISLSWALLANRRSCFAGTELALAFSSLRPEARDRAAGLFDRVFAGTGSAADDLSLVRDFDCRVIVLTPQDGAWDRDLFAESALFTRVEKAESWRIYRAAPLR